MSEHAGHLEAFFLFFIHPFMFYSLKRAKKGDLQPQETSAEFMGFLQASGGAFIFAEGHMTSGDTNDF